MSGTKKWSGERTSETGPWREEISRKTLIYGFEGIFRQILNKILSVARDFACNFRKEIHNFFEIMSFPRLFMSYFAKLDPQRWNIVSRILKSRVFPTRPSIRLKLSQYYSSALKCSYNFCKHTKTGHHARRIKRKDGQWQNKRAGLILQSSRQTPSGVLIFPHYLSILSADSFSLIVFSSSPLTWAGKNDCWPVMDSQPSFSRTYQTTILRQFNTWSRPEIYFIRCQGIPLVESGFFIIFFCS